jgi:hypothetical protein
LTIHKIHSSQMTYFTVNSHAPIIMAAEFFLTASIFI